MLEVDAANARLGLIAVYLPHCGYGAEEAERVYEMLEEQIESARRRGYKVIVGGDFQTELNNGDRGERLQSFAACNQLEMTHGREGDAWGDTWTFISNLGRRRCIGYILVDGRLKIRQSRAVDELQLGSDHRAVKADIEIGKARARHVRRRSSLKGWEPELDATGKPQKYWDALGREVRPGMPLTDLELCLVTAGRRARKQKTQINNGAPWISDEGNHLIKLRRGATNPEERRDITKQLRKVLRQNLRRWKNNKIQNTLDEFRNLQRLDLVTQFPVKRQIVTGRPADLDFAKDLADIYKTDAKSEAPTAHRATIDITIFTASELTKALRQVASNKGADSTGVVAELIKHGNL